MLVGAHCAGVAQDNALPPAGRPDTVRDDAVPGIVPAPNGVPRPGRGDGNPLLLQKRPVVAAGHQLGTGLAVGVGLFAIQAFILPVAPHPLPVLVDLVGGNIQKGTDRVRLPDALQNMDRTHNVGGVGSRRIPIRLPHQRLGRQMEHNFRGKRPKGVPQALQVPDVPCYRRHPLRQLKPVE